MTAKAEREFLDLDVNEVSLVDTPANEQRWIVIKRMTPEETQMSTANANKPAPATNASEGAPVEVPVTVTKAADDAAKDLLAQIEGLSTLIKKQQAATEAEVEKAMPPKMKEFMDKMKAGGAKDDEIKKAVETAKGLGLFGDAPAAKPAPAPVAKSMDDQVREAVADVLQSAVIKAKTFTKGRQESLKSALETLKGLLDELQGESGQKAAAAAAEEMGEKSGPGPSSGFGNSGLEAVLKTQSQRLDTVTDTQAKLLDVVKALKTVMDGAVETKPAPKGEGDPAPVTKKQPSMWSGVL